MIFGPLASAGRSFFSPVTQRHLEQRVLHGIPPSHLFQIVQDVARYHEFLPLCSESRITRVLPPATTTSMQRPQQQQQFQAVLTVGFVPPLLSETYESLVTVDAANWTIRSVSLPGKSTWMEGLTSTWKLKEINENNNSNVNDNAIGNANSSSSTFVDFSVELTARDPLVVQTLDQMLPQVAQQQVEAFEQRCRALLPRPPPPQP